MAGWITEWGYRKIEVDGRAYLAHRLAWLYMTGEWPEGEVDHKDCDPANNEWGNLRLATRGQNAQNSSLRADNTSGVKGVSKHPQYDKWVARVGKDGKKHYLGVFPTKEGAEAAAKAFRQALHGEFANHG